MVSKNFKVPGEKQNKKFFTFHKRSYPLQRQGQDVNTDIKNRFATIDDFHYLDQSEETKSAKRLVDSKTIDTHNKS